MKFMKLHINIVYMVIDTIYFQSGTEPGVQEGIPAEREEDLHDESPDGPGISASERAEPEPNAVVYRLPQERGRGSRETPPLVLGVPPGRRRGTGPRFRKKGLVRGPPPRAGTPAPERKPLKHPRKALEICPLAHGQDLSVQHANCRGHLHYE